MCSSPPLLGYEFWTFAGCMSIFVVLKTVIRRLTTYLNTCATLFISSLPDHQDVFGIYISCNNYCTAIKPKLTNSSTTHLQSVRCAAARSGAFYYNELFTSWEWKARGESNVMLRLAKKQCVKRSRTRLKYFRVFLIEIVSCVLFIEDIHKSSSQNGLLVRSTAIVSVQSY